MFLNKLDKEQKLFYLFLIIHFLVWSMIGLIRVVLPTDSLEGIWWGSFLNAGNPKHPPLAGWITYLTYTVFKSNVSIYVLSQTFILGGFIYVYKLAKNFLTKNQAMLSVVLLEGCWIYCYVTGYYGFNPDVVLLFTLPAITYYFYQCMFSNKFSNWLMLGILTGISFLDKFQSGLLIVAMAVWALLFRRKTFKNKYFYMAVIIAFILFSPHLFWLIKHDFMPFLYLETKLETLSFIRHLTEPFMFLFMQIVQILTPVCMYLLFKKVSKSPFKLNKNIDEKGWFLIILTMVPLIIHLLIALQSGSNVRPQWGYVFWYMTGIILLYFIPSEINESGFKRILKYSYTVMFIIFLSFGTMLTVEKNYRSRYPVAKVFGDFKQIWNNKYNTPLKYIGGFSEWTFPITIYGDTHPINIMDTYGYKNLWLDEEDLKKSGAFIVGRSSDFVVASTKSSCPYLSDEIEIVPVEYKFTLTNALNQSREYTIYYYIVPPQNI